MINFQRIIKQYKEDKKKALKKIENSIYHIKEGCFNTLVFPCSGCFGDNTSITIGIFVANLERDLGETIPLLREFKEKLQSAKQYFHKGHFIASEIKLEEAEMYLLQFKKREFEKILTTALKKSLKKIQL